MNDKEMHGMKLQAWETTYNQRDKYSSERLK
jgi:hypothetical protein